MKHTSLYKYVDKCGHWEEHTDTEYARLLHKRFFVLKITIIYINSVKNIALAEVLLLKNSISLLQWISVININIITYKAISSDDDIVEINKNDLFVIDKLSSLSWDMFTCMYDVLVIIKKQIWHKSMIYIRYYNTWIF